MDNLVVKQEFTSSSVICRFCLAQNSSYYQVFDENVECPELLDVLRSMLGVHISPHDNWPKSICTICVQKIYDFRTFQSQTKENEFRLTDVFGEYLIQEDKDFSVSLQSRGSPVFIETEVKQLKAELVDQVKDESEDFCTDADSDRGTKAVLRARRRSASKKCAKKTPMRAVKKVEQVKEEKKPKDEKRDKEIHTFFKMDCVLCNGLHFERFAELQKHFRAEHKCRGYVVCCGKKLNSPMKMQLHMENHRNPIKYQCNICLKYYNRHDILLTHQKLQHTPVEEREFACDKCPQRFALASALKRHMVNHMPPEERKHICETCGRAFPASHVLTAHIRRMHENAMDSVCEICAKVYRSKYLFRKHMAEHNNQLTLSIPCPLCGKLFKYYEAMQKHKRRHDTSGNLECQYCQHVAANRRALHEHIKRVHTERKSYHCSLCDRIFRMKRSLKEHMANHTGEMLYKCPYCPKEFNSNGNFFHHRRTTHPMEYKAEQERRRSEQIYQKPD